MRLLSDFRADMRQLYATRYQNGEPNPHFTVDWINAEVRKLRPDHEAAFSLLVEARFGPDWKSGYDCEPRIYSIGAVALDDMIDDAEDMLGIENFENGGLDCPPTSLLYLGPRHTEEY